MRHRLIRLALDALSAARAPAWLPAPAGVGGFVVTLHHVGPGGPAAFAPNALLAVTPDFLDLFLAGFIARGWRFVSVADLLRPPEPGSAGWRRIAVTLDDGYRNNLEQAWPVFRRHAVPFTIYACPGFCDRTAELWWEALERIVAAADDLALPGDGPPPMPTRSAAEKARAFRDWTRWLTTVADERRQRVAIRALAARYGLDLAALAEELVMSWDELRQIAADPLCTIGAHTLTHPALARLPPQEAMREMAGSAARLEAELGARPATLAFPYGYPAAAGRREAQLAAEAGFHASFTTQPGTVPAAGPHHGLPRVSLNGLFQDLRDVEVLLTPRLWAARSRLKRAG